MSQIEMERLDDGRIARITFNRPEKLNAFTLSMYGELDELITEAEDDDAVKVIILRGSGSSFSSGQDLAEVGLMYGFGTQKDDRRPSIRRRLNVDRRWANRYLHFFECSKLTIAQVHGHTLGTGFALMLQADFAIAAEDANIGHPGERIAGPGLDFNLPLWISHLGMRRAKELIFTGRTLTGAEAAEIDLVNKAVPLADLEDEVMRLAKELCLMPADGIVMGKEAFRMSYHLMGLSSAFAFGAISHTLGTNLRFEPGEFNYFRERREMGARDAFHLRDERYAEVETPPE